MPNLHELDLTIKDIEANPADHYQGAWATRKTSYDATTIPPRDTVTVDMPSGTLMLEPGPACGTAMCAAGFTVARHGYQFLFHGLAADFCMLPDGQPELISTVAARILDLNEDQACELFYSGNSLDDIKQYRDKFAAEAEEADEGRRQT